jgi:hypothetical protein
MSIHIPQAFLHGNGSGHGHNGNYLVNKYASSYGSGPAARSVNEPSFKFDEDTSNYFYSELSKILNTDAFHRDGGGGGDGDGGGEISENTIVSNEDNNANICLITKEKLEPNHITLSCNHKFNYVPLYNEVVNQKNKQNNMYEITKLSANQIKCPYCRVITNKLLPYIAYPSVKLTKNVNSYITSNYNNNTEYFLSAPKCSYDNTKNQCQKYGVYYETENILLCPQHYKTYITKQKTSNKKCEDDDIHCCAILKSGKNIGKRCGMLCVEGVEGVSQTNIETKYCKKHYKLYCNT